MVHSDSLCMFFRWWAGLTTGILIVLAIGYAYRLYRETVEWADLP